MNCRGGRETSGAAYGERIRISEDGAVGLLARFLMTEGSAGVCHR